MVDVSGLVGLGFGLALGGWLIYNEYLDFGENWSILIYDICGKGKRSFPIKFLVRDFSFAETAYAAAFIFAVPRLNLFKGSQGSGQGPEVLNGVQG